MDERNEAAVDNTHVIDRLQLSPTQILNVGIQTSKADVVAYSPTVEIFGRVVTNANAAFDITSPASGRLSIVNDRWPMPGTLVTKGQALASVKVRVSPDLRSEFESRVTEAESRLQHDKDAVEALARIREGLERISNKEIISRTEFDTAVANLSKAKAQLEHNKAIAEKWKMVLEAIDSEDNVEQGLWQLPILAPHNGTVADLATANGTNVEIGTPLLSIIDQTQQLIQLSVPNDRFALDELMTHATLDVRIRGKIFPASYKGLASSIDLTSQSFHLLYSVESGADEIRPGLLVSTKYPTGKSDVDAIAIPSSGVIQHKGLNYVYVAVDGSRYERRSIQILGVTSDRTYVLPMSDTQADLAIGVKSGEQIVTAGTQVLLSREFLTEGGEDD